MSERERWAAGAVLGAAIAGQSYAALLAARYPSVFERLFAGLGAPLPMVTRTFLATAQWWPAVPVLFALVGVDLLRRRQPNLFHYAGVLLVAMAATVGMLAWIHEAFFAPAFSILQAVG
jgi:hypothetical protein